MSTIKIILGIDPGLCVTGYGIIQGDARHAHCVTYGCIKTSAKAPMHHRLHQVYAELCHAMETFHPEEAVLESIFTGRNHQSALKLGQARGAALVATATHDLPIIEYNTRHIKKTMTGYGAANKQQMQYMVRRLLSLKQTPPTDAADALAIALCHLQSAAVLLSSRCYC